MKQIPVYHIDAFTDMAFGGNPAGVVLNAELLKEEEMQKIANEINLPETAFLLPASEGGADYKVRYFTPQEEINFCGHATVGLSWLLATRLDLANKTDEVVFETNVGLILIEWVKENNRLVRVSMTQIAPQVKEIDIDKNRAAELAGISPGDLDDKFPIKLGSTGNWHLFIPVKSRKAIDAAEPKMKELASMNREHNISTTHLFTFDPDSGFDIYTRDFAPGIGIDEDPVTGAANGALAGYLALEGFLSANETHRLKVGQGHAINRPGTLHITVSTKDSQPNIEVAGSAVMTIEGQLNLPSGL